MPGDPPKADIARELILAEIRDTFRGVTRLGGVSWSESEVIDSHGTSKECAVARASDKDTQWQQVVDDLNWSPDSGVGGFNFLDPIGYRYYLPAAMTCVIFGRDNGMLPYHLTASGPNDEFRMELWSLLNAEQRRCVRRFLEYMARTEEDETDAELWSDALDSYWKLAR
jgi:hypothetical protein